MPAEAYQVGEGLFGNESNEMFFGVGWAGEAMVELSFDNTIYGMGGDDYLEGDAQFSSPPGTTFPHPDVDPATGPYRLNALIESSASEPDVFSGRLFLEAGQTITVDVDYAAGSPFSDVDTEIAILFFDGEDFVRIAGNEDADAALGAWGSVSDKDPFLTFTATESGTHIIVVGKQLDGNTGGVDGLGFEDIDVEALFQVHVTSSQPFTNPEVSIEDLVLAEPPQGEGADELYGGDGNDIVYGQGQADSLFGGADDDLIDGGWGQDYISAGSGHDTAHGGLGKDTIDGDSGRDSLFGNDGRDVLNGNGWNDELYGQSGDDRLFGGVGKDTVNGGGGDDVLRGGDGRDRMIGGDGKDVLHGDSGEDQLFGRDGADILNGNADDDKLNGQAGADKLFGGGGDDILTGGGGKDVLKGGKGDDRLNGGDGDDTLEGGNGADAFVFKNFNPNDRDVIEDFQDGQDMILLKGAVPTGISDVPTGALIAFANGYEILVKGVDASDLGADDFDYI